LDLTPDELELLERLRDDPAKLAAATKALQGPRTGKRNQRAKGEGSVFKVTSGGHAYWRAQIEAGHYPNGNRRYGTVTRKTKRAAIDTLPELRRRVGAGIVVHRGDTVGPSAARKHVETARAAFGFLSEVEARHADTE